MSLDRAVYLPDLYPDRWAPVLIAWSDPAEVPTLAGFAAGVDGSAWLQPPEETTVYVSGIVVLDGPELNRLLEQQDGDKHVRAVIQHELAHLVGLAHVEDETHLMNAFGSEDVTDFAAGDLIGLHHLGRGACVPGL